MVARVLRAFNELLAEIFLDRERVVGATAQGDVLCRVLAAQGEGSQVVEARVRASPDNAGPSRRSKCNAPADLAETAEEPYRRRGMYQRLLALLARR